MRIGTKSVLFGAHCFFLHPIFVAWAWWRLYGFPSDLRLWVAFFVHDIGYLGKPNMDGPEGEEHPTVGALIMSWLFDGRFIHLLDDLKIERHWRTESAQDRSFWYPVTILPPRSGEWHDFTLLHSRYYAKKLDKRYSRLCVADKLAIALTPWWLYLPMVNLTGEIHEYMANAQRRANCHEKLDQSERHGLLSGDQKLWYSGLQSYMRRWVEEHRDGRVDEWTQRSAAA